MDNYTTIGIDVSDRKSNICVMTMTDRKSSVVAETQCATTKAGFTEALSGFDRSWPVAFETGTHCRWMERHIRSMGFRVYVADPRKMPTLTRSATKNDRNDARELARLALADPELLHPVRLRGEVFQKMIRLHTARSALVATRTRLVSQVRGFAKSMGFRIEGCDAGRFHRLDRTLWPGDLEELACPLIGVLKEIDVRIKAYEALIGDLSETPEFRDKVERCRQVFGVGVVGATVFVAAVAETERFARARDAGPYVGLVPRQDQSGETDRQLRVTKAGPSLVRRVLLECAAVAMKDAAPDTDLKLKGLRIAARGGRTAAEEGALRGGAEPRGADARAHEASGAGVCAALGAGEGGVRAAARLRNPPSGGGQGRRRQSGGRGGVSRAAPDDGHRTGSRMRSLISS